MEKKSQIAKVQAMLYLINEIQENYRDAKAVEVFVQVLSGFISRILAGKHEEELVIKCIDIFKIWISKSIFE